jgi:hypothetical protein
MLEQLQTWWQNAGPETQTYIQEGGWLLLALVGGHFVAAIIGRALRARNFDAVLRASSSSSALAGQAHGFTPTWAAGMLIRLTIWAGAACWMARRHGRDDLAETLGLAISRSWAFAAVLVATLALGGLLARRLAECLHGSKAGDGWSSRNGGAAAPRGWDAGGAVGAGAYVLVVLLALLFMADVFDWPLTRTSALALWQFAQQFLVALAALFIGCLGARWAREVATPDASASPGKRAGQYTALGLMAGTTVLAVIVLLSASGVLVGLAILAILGVVLWLVRGHLPDVTAGLQLRAHRVRDVHLDGAVWQVAEVGLLTTQVCRAGEFCSLRNRQVLEARLDRAPMEAASR